MYKGEKEMTERVRGFEVVSTYKDKGINVPKRATKGSAGYDLEAAEDTVIPSIWKAMKITEEQLKKGEGEYLKSTLVPTGIKAYMPEDEYLLLANRSSNPMKRQLALPNGIGVIDSDYYNNEGNEGEIFVQLINYSFEDVTIKKGERIAQGIFQKYEVIDEEVDDYQTRIGGFGSSGE